MSTSSKLEQIKKKNYEVIKEPILICHKCAKEPVPDEIEFHGRHYSLKWILEPPGGTEF